MACACGAKNYKKGVLLEVVKEVLPTRAYEWNKLLTCIKRDPELHNKDDIKCHWVEKLCNKFKKPSGSAGGAHDFVLVCQRVQAKIHKKCESTLMGAHSDEENEDEFRSNVEYKEEASSESEEESKQEGEEDGGTEEVENVDVLTVPALPLIQNQDDSLQHDIVAICDNDVGEDIGNVDQPAVCTAANVAILNEVMPVDNIITMKGAATVQGNEICWHALKLHHCS
ncbi:LOW QUALITY PROTEIN: hypothetical protein ACHAW6_008448 [Cyclotella cf. meneghiniana]